MKDARLQSHAAYIRSLPYYNYYEEFNGHPPLHPHLVQTLSLQIAEADYQLRCELDSDWRSCVIRYPDVLAHYFSIVKVTLPQDPLPPASSTPAPPLGFIAPPPSRASYAGSTVSAFKKKERLGGGGSKTPEPKTSSSSVAGPTATSAAASSAKLSEPRDSGDNVLGGAIAKIFGASATAVKSHKGAASASASGAASSASTSAAAAAARRGPLAGRGTAMPDAAMRHQYKRRSVASDYVLSGYAHMPPHMRPPSNWQALSARFI